MRMMLKAIMDTEAGNEAIRNGSMSQVVDHLVKGLSAEAAYFFPEDGHRTALVVFDLADPSQIPALTEPLFSSGRARVTLTPCMNLDDLQKGLGQVQI